MRFPHSSVGKESACNAEDLSSIPGSGRSAGEGIGYSLQYSWASLVAHLVKNPLQCRKPWFNSWAWKIPWRRHRLLTPVFLGFPGSSDRLRSLPPNFSLSPQWFRSIPITCFLMLGTPSEKVGFILKHFSLLAPFIF